MYWLKKIWYEIQTRPILTSFLTRTTGHGCRRDLIRYNWTEVQEIKIIDADYKKCCKRWLKGKIRSPHPHRRYPLIQCTEEVLDVKLNIAISAITKSTEIKCVVACYNICEAWTPKYQPVLLNTDPVPRSTGHYCYILTQNHQVWTGITL